MKKEKYISLIYKHLKGEANKSEVSELSHWLAATEENREIERIVRKDWELSNQYTPDIKVDVKADFSKLRQRIQSAAGSSKNPNSNNSQKHTGRERSGAPPDTKVVQMKPRRRWMAIAAAVVALMTAGWWLFFNASPEMMVVETGAGEKQNLELPDGSKIWLNENSRIAYPVAFTGEKRPVQLTGEGFFDVTKNAEQPFVINTEHAEVTVLGTSFNIRSIATENEVVVSVEEGRVRLKPNDVKKSLILNKDEKGVFDFVKYKLDLQVMESGNEHFWKTGKLVFKDIPLSKVVADLEKYFSVKISLEQNGMENCLVTGGFPKATAKDVLESIALNFKMELKNTANKEFELTNGFCK